jgi:hypothetical protein
MQRFIVALTCVAASTLAAQAMPVGRDHGQSVIDAVADKCGINRYRDASGVCRRTHQIAKPPKQFYSTCGGVNAHRVCNWTGHCWMVCD